ncbi:81689dfa-d2dd-40f7-80b6-083b685e4e49 [Thermothielavioides terrestris]|jgi:hypothetical protein|uniref:81689dfa-d2dd-40f7-80b6-083b685e4e49 n=1 Tax=Thermothielavioides terrestris TaxID=2587410 RepID=A0A3S4ATZ6_9PEZI|nr:81689dfa-d2dd-40f7-80b6-083b685e4e49 [Thermothielavioides terrestris]
MIAASLFQGGTGAEQAFAENLLWKKGPPTGYGSALNIARHGERRGGNQGPPPIAPNGASNNWL